MYCLHKLGEVCTQFQEKNSYTFCYAWCNLHRSQFNKVCTQFNEKPVLHLPRKQRTLGTAFIGCRVRWAMQAIQGKTTMHLVALYGLQTLCQTSERMLDPASIGYRVQLGLYTILGKTSYTPIKTYETSLRNPVHNSKKTQLYTYLTCENRPS